MWTTGLLFFFCSIDATFSKRRGRYANDAPRSDPQCNAEVLPFYLDYRPYLALFARRYIHAGEEIRYDYGVKKLILEENRGIMIICSCFQENYC